MARDQRGGAAHGLVQGAAGRITHLREGVQEDHHVGVPLEVELVDVQRIPACGDPPVDAAHQIARREGADVGELDALAFAP